jgi:hypothetical protein
MPDKDSITGEFKKARPKRPQPLGRTELCEHAPDLPAEPTQPK